MIYSSRRTPTHTYLHFLERELQQEAAAPQRTNERDLVVEYLSLVVEYLSLVVEYLSLVLEYLSLVAEYLILVVKYLSLPLPRDSR